MGDTVDTDGVRIGSAAGGGSEMGRLSAAVATTRAGDGSADFRRRNHQSATRHAAAMLATSRRVPWSSDAAGSAATGTAGIRAGMLRTNWLSEIMVCSMRRRLSSMSCTLRASSTPLRPTRHSMRSTERSSSEALPRRRRSSCSLRRNIGSFAAATAAVTGSRVSADKAAQTRRICFRQLESGVAADVGIESEGAEVLLF